MWGSLPGPEIGVAGRRYQAPVAWIGAAAALDGESQHRPERRGEILTVMARIAEAAAVTERHVEQPVRIEQQVAAVVLCIGLLHLQHIGVGALQRASIRARREHGEHAGPVAVGAVDPQPPVGAQRHAHQALIVLGRRVRGEIGNGFPADDRTEVAAGLRREVGSKSPDASAAIAHESAACCAGTVEGHHRRLSQIDIRHQRHGTPGCRLAQRCRVQFGQTRRTGRV